MVMELAEYLSTRGNQVEKRLRQWLPRSGTKPKSLHEAMRYSLFAGGKRLRPILVLAAAEACGDKAPGALDLACAVECIHTYSLIHDDLPCMDDDDFRRGKPTCHKRYGEGVAVLAGDALLTLAFAICAESRPAKRYPATRYASELAGASGSLQLIAGQVADLEAEGKSLKLSELRYIHLRKTSALLTCAIRLGAMSANATPRKLEALTAFGTNLGLAFQVIDDILDETQSLEVLGKTAGKDAAAGKATYPAIMGLDRSRREAERLTAKALKALTPLGARADRLRDIGGHLLKRSY